MKKFILNFKQTVRFIVAIITSREFAFIYCLLGTIGQIAHTYFLTESISSLQGGWRTTQAVMLSIFISSSLLYFTAIADDAETKESRKIHLAVTLFTIIEILINIYYYSRHLIIDQETYQIFDFIFAVLISCLIPVTIKLYSSHIRAKEWILDIEHDKQAFVSSDIKMEFTDIDNNDASVTKVLHDWAKIVHENEEKIVLTEDQVADIAADVVSAMVPESIQDNDDFLLTNDSDVWGLNDQLAQDKSDIDDIIDETIEQVEDESKPIYERPLSEDKVKEMIIPFVKEYQKEIQTLREEIEQSSNPESNEKINVWFEEKVKNLDTEISKSFEKNRDLFLTQFENKVKLIIKQKTGDLNQ